MRRCKIRCEVVAVDKDTTSCQEVGASFMIDPDEKRMCGNAWSVVSERAEEMSKSAHVADESPEGWLDVPCPDDHVVYRLTRVLPGDKGRSACHAEAAGEGG